MRKQLKYKNLRRLKYSLLRIRLNLFEAISFLKGSKDSYYPETERKSLLRQKIELIWSYLRHGQVERYYYTYGLDRKGMSLKNFIDYPTFVKYRNGCNMTEPFSYICLLRDKELFSLIGESFGLPMIRTLGVFGMGGVIINKL